MPIEEEAFSNEREMTWVRECLEGNSNAFEPLMENSERIVRGMLMRMLNNTASVEEIAQQSFITAFERLHQFKGDSKFSTWVCQIALNKTRDHQRKQRPQANIEPEELACDNNQLAPEAVLSTQQHKHSLNTAISQLKPNDRELISFKYIYGYSYELIAQILDCTPQAARVRSVRARNSLKSILTNMGIDYGQ